MSPSPLDRKRRGREGQSPLFSLAAVEPKVTKDLEGEGHELRLIPGHGPQADEVEGPEGIGFQAVEFTVVFLDVADVIIHALG